VFGGDLEAYWQAAVRLREGHELYPPLTDVDAHSVFRYSAWFAYSWIPLTYLPKALVTACWVLLLLAATLLSVRPLMAKSTPAVALLILIAPLMIQSAWFGQIQPLLAYALVMSLNSRGGPVVVGVAASLKALPILFALVYIARGDWRSAFASVATASVLAAPTLLHSLADYPFDAGRTVSLWSLSPWLYVAMALSVVGIAGVMLVRAPHRAALVAGAATIFASPRIYVDMMSYLLPAVHESGGNKK
jgi:hypothetical protein